MERLTLWLEMLRHETAAIWTAGGWCMPPIAVTGFLMFGIGFHILMKLRATGFQSVKERTWRRWVEDPAERRGPVGDLIAFVTGGRSLRDAVALFAELRAAELHGFERDLRVMKVCIGAAPLLGLLGTVTGMLATFAALGGGSGGDKTMDLVAKGISEALITTETGLVVALPGLFFQYQLGRKYERYKVFLAHLESVCTQSLYRRLRREKVAA